MSPRLKFGVFLGLILAITVTYYFLTTERDQGLVLIGTVDANQVIVSSKIAGRIERLRVDEGTRVQQGDLIAELDSAELQAQKRAAEAVLASLRSQVSGSRANAAMAEGTTSSDVRNAQARLEAARSQLAEAQADWERQTSDTARAVSMADQGIASQQDRDRATAALKAAQARVQSFQDQVRAAQAGLGASEARTHQAHAAEETVAATEAQMRSARAQLAEVETRLGYTRIFAPVSGIAAVRAARQGEVVHPGQPIVTLVDLNDTWVRAAIPETYADRILLGDLLSVRMPGGAVIPGKVILKSAEGDFATQRDVSRRKRDIKTVALKVKIDNPNMKYATGMTAEVLVPESKLTGKVESSSADQPGQTR